MERSPRLIEEGLGTEKRMAETRALLAGDYSSVVLFPYSARVSGLGRDNKPLETRKTSEKRPANVVMGSYSAMVTEAGRVLHNMDVASHVIAVGEQTFHQGPTTAKLMEHQLTKDINTTRINGREARFIMEEGQLVHEHGLPLTIPRGTQTPRLRQPLPAEHITLVHPSQDTDKQAADLAQLKNDSPELMGQPLVIVMEFHKKRVGHLLQEHGVQATLISAEDILLEHWVMTHQDLKAENRAEYERKFRQVRDNLAKFTREDIWGAEAKFDKVANLPFAIGQMIGKGVRAVRGETTVCDFANLYPSRKWGVGNLRFDGQEDIAKKAVQKGKLRPGDITA